MKFLPTEQKEDELLVGNEAIKVVPGQLLEMDDTPKFIPGKTIEIVLGNIFIPVQTGRTGPNKMEQFVPGQVTADRRPQRTNVLPRYFHDSFVLRFMLTNFHCQFFIGQVKW